MGGGEVANKMQQSAYSDKFKSTLLEAYGQVGLLGLMGSPKNFPNPKSMI